VSCEGYFFRYCYNAYNRQNTGFYYFDYKGQDSNQPIVVSRQSGFPVILGVKIIYLIYTTIVLLTVFNRYQKDEVMNQNDYADSSYSIGTIYNNTNGG